MTPRAALRVVVLLLVLTAAVQARGYTGRVTLDAVRDNTLYESAIGALSNGAGSYFFAGRTSQFSDSKRRGLIAFSVASLPSGSMIDSVAVLLYMSRGQLTPATVALHQALADWGEGTSDALFEEGLGAESTPGDATWIHRFFDTDFWASAGGDFDATPSASAVVSGVGSYTWSSPGLVADVQSWLDAAATNFGWILIGDEQSSGSAKRFDSRQGPDPALRPRLFVEFTTPTDALPLPPRAPRLQAAFPNPFNPGTTLVYELPAAEFVLLRIRSVTGRLVRTLVRRDESAGVHAAGWDGRDASGRRLGSGVYFVELQAGGVSASKRLVLLE